MPMAEKRKDLLQAMVEPETYDELALVVDALRTQSTRLEPLAHRARAVLQAIDEQTSQYDYSNTGDIVMQSRGVNALLTELARWIDTLWEAAADPKDPTISFASPRLGRRAEDLVT